MKELELTDYYTLYVAEHISDAKEYQGGLFNKYYNKKQFFKDMLNKFERHDFDFDTKTRGTETISSGALPGYVECCSGLPDTLKCYGMYITTAPDSTIAIFKLKDITKKMFDDCDPMGFAMKNPDDGEIYFIYVNED